PDCLHAGTATPPPAGLPDPRARPAAPTCTWTPYRRVRRGARTALHRGGPPGRTRGSGPSLNLPCDRRETVTNPLRPPPNVRATRSQSTQKQILRASGAQEILRACGAQDDTR